MTNNLIPFPKQNHRDKRNRLNASREELKSLRKAFDKARQGWPIEIAELPENNKIYSTRRK